MVGKGGSIEWSTNDHQRQRLPFSGAAGHDEAPTASDIAASGGGSSFLSPIRIVPWSNGLRSQEPGSADNFSRVTRLDPRCRFWQRHVGTFVAYPLAQPVVCLPKE